MTKVLRNLKAGLLALAVSVIALGAAGLAVTDQAEAQSPPTPPARFTGIVTIDGEIAASGTAVVALVDGESCGVAQVDSNGRYVVDVSAFIPGQNNCGVDGGDVTFLVGTLTANETGEWHNHQLNILDLTVTSPTPTPVPTEEPPAGTETPGAEATATPLPPTPAPPDTGSGLGNGSGSNAGLLLAIVAFAAMALGTSGVALARRRNR